MLGSGTRKESDAYLINCGVNPADLHTVAYFDSIESIKRAIEQGMGIAIMSEISVLDTEQQKKVLVFRNENPFMHRRLYCVYRKERQLSPHGGIVCQVSEGYLPMMPCLRRLFGVY